MNPVLVKNNFWPNKKHFNRKYQIITRSKFSLYPKIFLI